jgi:hypothetical protein
LAPFSDGNALASRSVNRPYINLLAVMLVVHLSAGLAAARVMAWGVIALGLMLGLLHGLYLVLAEQPGVGLRVLTQVDHWASGLRIQSQRAAAARAGGQRAAAGVAAPARHASAAGPGAGAAWCSWIRRCFCCWPSGRTA